MNPGTLADELEKLAANAEQTDDDVQYYAGGSAINVDRVRLYSVLSANLPTILAALRSCESCEISEIGVEQTG